MRAKAAPAAQPRLPVALQKRLADTGLPPGSFGVHAVDVDNGSTLLSMNASEPFVMASTAKIVTSLAALDLLGPNYRWRTRAYVRGLLADGHLYGDLILVGGGDVLLSTEELLAWFASMQAKGLQHVHGRILLDRAAFRLGADDFVGTPEPAPNRPHHIRPNALTLDAGVIRVAVQTARGGLAQVHVNPPLQGVQVLNSVATHGGCNAFATYRMPRGGDGEMAQLQIRGNWSSSCGTREIAFAPLPVEELMSRAVGQLWRDAGGHLSGEVCDDDDARRDTTLPSERPGQPLQLWSVHGSPSLAQWIHGMNKVSDNVAARHLMLSMAPGFPRRPATMDGAQARVRTWLQSQGLQAGDLALDNGSGLSRAEKARPWALVHLLRRAWSSSHAQTFIDSLPVSGVDGTLMHRLGGPGVRGRAHLKTGTLLDARALAGYVHARNGRWYAVSTLVNHPEAALGTPALDAIIDWIAAR